MLNSIFSIKNKSNLSRAFTLVELMVSVSIFAFMTTFLLARYGTFNQGVFLTNLAYDVAIAVRSAQAYGLNVRGATEVNPNTFNYSYGIYFSTEDNNGENEKFTLFTELKDDTETPKTYGGDDVMIQEYVIKRNMNISNIWASDNCTKNSNESKNNVSIVFTRPDPRANIRVGGETSDLYYNCAVIELSASDGSKSYVKVRKTGQISVEND